MQFQLLLT